MVSFFDVTTVYSNPFFNFLASRWSDDEFVVGKEGEIYQQGSLLGDFFIRKMEPFLQRIRMGDFIQRMGEGRREGDQFASIEPWKVLTSKLKANVNVFLSPSCPGTKGHRDKKFFLSWDKGTTGRNTNSCLSGAWLAGSAATDFKSVMNKLSVGEPQDFYVDLIVKIEDFTVKVIQN